MVYLLYYKLAELSLVTKYMAEEKMHGNGCTCNSGDMMGHIGHKNRHKLLKFVVIVIFMFMSFSIGVHFGEIKGALGITPFSQYKQMHGYNSQNMMYGNPVSPTMMQQY